ncbi:hypothetical protein [Thermospira aquatica]|uniref:Uncharacterized protein n=1 Tax=Thermospira aquatica TaxID=2828656 RepID=A0AAX3BFI8_9SPIR|nr:hypothetical protein [Thermospira aquatica]URA11045.1 hypothetical protein KDW03_04385 [Thermospira aquatica]
MKSKWYFVFFLFPACFFAELSIDKMSIQGNQFLLTVRTYPPSGFNPFSFLQGGSTLWVGYNILVFKKQNFPEPDIFLTNICVRYEVKRDYLNNGYVANVWYGWDFAYRRWLDNDEKLLRFLYRLENFRAFTFSNPGENDFFYLEVSQFFDTVPEKDDTPLGRFFRSVIGSRYEFSPVRSRMFNKNGLLFE